MVSSKSDDTRFKRVRYNDDGHKLNIIKKPKLDDLIQKEDYHSYIPYVQSYNNSDVIRIEIQSSDLITAPYSSFIKISGTYAGKVKDKAVTITNNAACFFFDEIQLRLGHSEIIDVCKFPGITSFIKGIVSYTKDDETGLSPMGWTLTNNQQVFVKNKFSCCIPLSHLFGFCEDYEKVIVRMPLELILIRSKSDINCYQSSENEVEFKISKISWEVPHVTLSDEANLELHETLRSRPDILASYRRWELHELHALPQSNKTVWRLKNANQSDKPRCVLVAFQQNKIGRKDTNATDLSNADITNLKLQLNSTEFPYQRMNLNFKDNDYLMAYHYYKNFRKFYYNKSSMNKCILDYQDFKNNPIFVIDCSRQEESLKESPVDVRLEIEAAANFEAGTKVYALILHDNVIQYNPFTEMVTRVIRD